MWNDLNVIFLVFEVEVIYIRNYFIVWMFFYLFRFIVIVLLKSLVRLIFFIEVKLRSIMLFICYFVIVFNEM